ASADRSHTRLPSKIRPWARAWTAGEEFTGRKTGSTEFITSLAASKERFGLPGLTRTATEEFACS
ncbi:MAG TPA: hypothetical protein VKP67_26955, partial [Xanthobacteraceae bacterium]|nr:hypothetical protein [Xanthobacteraceae bacterium]